MVAGARSIAEINSALYVSVKEQHIKLNAELIELQKKNLVSRSANIKLMEVSVLIMKLGLEAINDMNAQKVISEVKKLRRT